MSGTTSRTEPLYSTLGGDPDLREIVNLFVAEMPGRVTTLLKQLHAQDWEGLRHTTHQLRGAAGSYGFHAISPAAGAVEDAIRSRQPEAQIRQSVASLIDLCRRARGGTPI